jgi:hypothetical protein
MVNFKEKSYCSLVLEILTKNPPNKKIEGRG